MVRAGRSRTQVERVVLEDGREHMEIGYRYVIHQMVSMSIYHPTTVLATGGTLISAASPEGWTSINNLLDPIDPLSELATLIVESTISFVGTHRLQPFPSISSHKLPE